MALTRKWMPSPCYNGRNINSVRILVLHTAEGATTIESLGSFFSNYANQVSSHTGADDKAGIIGEYVTRGNAAWTVANYNSVAVSLELCAFAAWSAAEWNRHPNMLSNCAGWIAEESKKLGIPITKLSPGQAQGGGRGVCQHKDLGAGGGGHVDCGPGFPMDAVLDMARSWGTKPQPEPEPPVPFSGEDDPVILSFVNPFNKNEECWEVNDKGNLYLRVRTSSTGVWANAVQKGSGFAGSPSVCMRDDGIDVMVARKGGGVTAYVFDPAHPGWTETPLTPQP
jgi:hypothetical protein